MTKFITWLRRKLGIKDRLVIVTSFTDLSDAHRAWLQKKIADELPDHCQVVILEPGTNVAFLK